jgi:hypothetical protein
MAADNIVANGLLMFNPVADKSHELVHIKEVCSPTDADGINPIDPKLPSFIC